MIDNRTDLKKAYDRIVCEIDEITRTRNETDRTIREALGELVAFQFLAEACLTVATALAKEEAEREQAAWSPLNEFPRAHARGPAALAD